MTTDLMMTTASNGYVAIPLIGLTANSFHVEPLSDRWPATHDWLLRNRQKWEDAVSRNNLSEALADVDVSTPPNYSIKLAVWKTGLDLDLAGDDKLGRGIRQGYWERIQELQQAALDEGITINPESHSDFLHFMRSLSHARAAALFLMDNGNFRVVWTGNDGSRLGLQFLGEGEVQWVGFKRRPSAHSVSRAVGTDTFDGVRRQIFAFGLGPTVYQ